MIDLIEENRPSLERLCEAYHVAKLEIFGSAARGEFDPASSDLDFLVEFQRLDEVSPSDQYFGLLAGLSDLFGVRIDLVEVGALRNPHFVRRVNESRQPLYAA